MLRFVTIHAVAMALSSAAPNSVFNVFKTDISPDEAAQYLNSPPFTEPHLSGRSAVRLNDPRGRAGDDYVEEVYDATQFHGQDGLGAYAYGYQTPQSSKVENRDRSGNVTGAYTFPGGRDGLIKVRYYADNQGFHQEDNLPKVNLQPNRETAAVRRARIAHERAWQKAAAASAPNSYGSQGEYNNNYDYNDDNREGSFQDNQYDQQNQQQKYYQPRYVRQSQKRQQYGQQQQYDQQTQKRQQYGQQQQYNQQQYDQQKYDRQQYGRQQYEPEPRDPARGFFYSFNYPVSDTQPKSEAQSGAFNYGQSVDYQG